jgi:plastocyanin
LSAAGASIRHYFIIRLKRPTRAKIFGVLGVGIIVGTALLTRDNTSASDLPKKIAEGAGAPALQNAEHAATIHGFVKFKGIPPPGEKILLSPGCSIDKKDVYSDEIIVNNGMLKNVFAQITKGLGRRSFGPAPNEPVLIDQRNCMYVPRVVAVRVGQQVEFINSDPTFHNVRAVTKHNESFNVAMPSQNDRITKIFNKPEILLQTKCSVHPWMTASIAVVDHPYFDISNDSGEFVIQNLPPGQYTLEVWHETLGTQFVDVTLKESENANVHFEYSDKKH